MGTIAEKLNKLLDTKADIKAAITEKGQDAGDVFSGYADKIRAIETGENLDVEMTTQDSLIEQIQAALVGKAAGSGGIMVSDDGAGNVTISGSGASGIIVG